MWDILKASAASILPVSISVSNCELNTDDSTWCCVQSHPAVGCFGHSAGCRSPADSRRCRRSFLFEGRRKRCVQARPAGTETAALCRLRTRLKHLQGEHADVLNTTTTSLLLLQAMQRRRFLRVTSCVDVFWRVWVCAETDRRRRGCFCLEIKNWTCASVCVVYRKL